MNHIYINIVCLFFINRHNWGIWRLCVQHTNHNIAGDEFPTFSVDTWRARDMDVWVSRGSVGMMGVGVGEF